VEWRFLDATPLVKDAHMEMDNYLANLIKEAEVLTEQLAEVQARIRAHTLALDGEFTMPDRGATDVAELCLET